jgi:hypothetical protein
MRAIMLPTRTGVLAGLYILWSLVIRVPYMKTPKYNQYFRAASLVMYSGFQTGTNEFLVFP